MLRTPPEILEHGGDVEPVQKFFVIAESRQHVVFFGNKTITTTCGQKRDEKKNMDHKISYNF